MGSCWLPVRHCSSAVLTSIQLPALSALETWFSADTSCAFLFFLPLRCFSEISCKHARARQRNAQQSALRASRMEVLSTVSHDLRNPLGVVESLADLLLDGDAGKLNFEQENLVQRIHASIRQVLNLSNNLIDAERIELDSFPVRRERKDLRRIVEQTLVPWRSAAELRHVSVETELPPLGAMAYVDGGQLGRALSNLLSNAINFTPRNGTVRVVVSPDGSGGWDLAVSDTGPGIPPEMLANLGQKHVAGTSAAGVGTGLGLFIASAIAQAHGGQVSGRLNSDRGTTITLSIPASATEAQVEEVDSRPWVLAEN